MAFHEGDLRRCASPVRKTCWFTVTRPCLGDGSSAASPPHAAARVAETWSPTRSAHVWVSKTCLYGVGADAAVLAAAADEANAMGSHVTKSASLIRPRQLTLRANNPERRSRLAPTAARASVNCVHVHGNRWLDRAINDDRLMPGLRRAAGLFRRHRQSGALGRILPGAARRMPLAGVLQFAEISTRSFGCGRGEERYDKC